MIAKEKERLQSEVEIASEVQNQLFPASAPAMRTIELIGVCQPARMVSGDYYDYLCLPDGNLAVAIGDVAGKGISAALLMASIQSIMRTQLAAGLPLVGRRGKWPVRDACLHLERRRAVESPALRKHGAREIRDVLFRRLRGAFAHTDLHQRGPSAATTAARRGSHSCWK